MPKSGIGYMNGTKMGESMKSETREKVEGHIQKSKDDWWDCLFCEKQHKGFPYECPNKIYRADGRIEHQCEHGVGHTVFIPPNRDDSWWVHGCDGCCKNYKRIGERFRNDNKKV